QDQRKACREPRRAQRRAQPGAGGEDFGRVDRDVQQDRRAVRPDQQDERGVRRSAGAAPRRGGGGRSSEDRPLQDPQPAGEALAHPGAHQDRCARARHAHRRNPEGNRFRRSANQRPAGKGCGVTERLVVKKEGALGWIVFNNPERRNAVSLDMWEAIPPALAKFQADAEVRVVVLTGAGDKAFVSGADSSQFEKQRSSEDAIKRYDATGEAAQAALAGCEKPVIAMIRGYCIGGGLNIALLCDLRIAAEDARFAIPAAKLGLGYRASSMKNLVDAVGAPNAREIMITARQF